MAKGIFSQTVCFLSDGSASIKQLRTAIKKRQFPIVKETSSSTDPAFGGDSLVISYRPEVNGYVSVDVVNTPWPDSMGDPKSDSMTFGAWSMGHFGPLTFPGGLERAGQHAWSWEPGRTIAKDHQGFVRARLSYAFGAGDHAPVMPKDCDPVDELHFLSQLSMAILDVPGILCYFNPNGEVLRDGDSFETDFTACTKQKKLPIHLWMNVRFFNLNERLGFMDTVGNGQLDIRDVEAIFPKDDYDPSTIDYYLRNVTLYLLGLDREIKSGEAIDGPGENNLTWTIDSLDDAAIKPPRRVLRLYPKVEKRKIEKALRTVGLE